MINQKNSKSVAALVFTVFFVLIIILLRWFFDKITFRPSKKHVHKPSVPYNDLMVDGVHIWHINNFPNRPTMIHCHGQSNNMSESVNQIDLANKMKINIILFDYHGYGFSRRTPSHEGLFESANTVMKYALAHARVPLIAWGESLGGSVAVRIASTYNLKHLVLLATFSCLDDIPKMSDRGTIVKMFGRVMPYLTETLRSYEIIQRVTCPITIVHSREDKLINFDHAKKLFENIKHDNKLLIPVTGGHACPVITQDDLNTIYRRCELGDTAPDCTEILARIAKWTPVCDEKFKDL